MGKEDGRERDGGRKKKKRERVGEGWLRQRGGWGERLTREGEETPPTNWTLRGFVGAHSQLELTSLRKTRLDDRGGINDGVNDRTIELTNDKSISQSMKQPISNSS